MTMRGVLFIGSLLIVSGSLAAVEGWQNEKCTKDRPLGCCAKHKLHVTLPEIHCKGDAQTIPSTNCLNQILKYQPDVGFWCDAYTPADKTEFRSSAVLGLKCLKRFNRKTQGRVDVVNVLRSLCKADARDFKVFMKKCVSDKANCFKIVDSEKQPTVQPTSPTSKPTHECHTHDYKNLIVPTLWDNNEAQRKCPDECRSLGSGWGFTKQWWQCGEKKTCTSGKGSVCRCKVCAQKPTPQPTPAVRVPVPHGKACDQSPDLTKCGDCKHYYNPQAGYGNNDAGKCVWVPAEGKCFANSWAQWVGMKIEEHCPDCHTKFKNLVVPTLEDNNEAQKQCPGKCAQHLGAGWSFGHTWWQCGQKHTCASGEGSVCRCEEKCSKPTPKPTTAKPTPAPSPNCQTVFKNLVVGTLRDNYEAQNRCPGRCQRRLGTGWSFTHTWWQCGEKHTCASGEGSVCRCEGKVCTGPTPKPTPAVRIPVPNGQACDHSKFLTKCGDCKHYYDARPGYGNTEAGKCVWVPSVGKCFPNWWAQRKGMAVSTHCKAPNPTPKPTAEVRVPVPHGKACDKSPDLRKCGDCEHYYDPRSGYGNTEAGKCVWVPAKGKCFPNSWAQRKGMEVSTQCQDCQFETKNLIVSTLEDAHEAQERCPTECAHLGAGWSYTYAWWQCGWKQTCHSGQGSVCECMNICTGPTLNLMPASSPDHAKLDEGSNLTGLPAPKKQAACLTAGKKCNPNHNTCCTKLGCEYVSLAGYYQCKRIDRA